MQQRGQKNSAYKIAFLGLMLSLAVAFSFLESLLPTTALLPPGIKLGLSNMVTMYCVFFVGAKPALAVAFAKSAFVLLTRGPVAAFMSVAGGTVSVAAMALVLRFFPELSNYFVSIAGAVFHNLGQLCAALIILDSVFAVYYLPVMVISGVIMGVITGILLRLVMPYLKNISTVFK